MKANRIRLGDVVGIPLEADPSIPIGFEECWDIGPVQAISLGGLFLTSTTNTHNLADKVRVKVNGAWVALASVRTFDSEELEYIHLNTAEYPR